MKCTNSCLEPSDDDEYSNDKEEVLGFRARFLLDLPLNTSLILRFPGFSEQVVWTTRVLEQPRLPSEQIWFDREEVRALISAAESERAWPSDLREWCWMKRESPDFILNHEIAHSKAQPMTDQKWTVGQILEWLELDLVSITLGRTIETDNVSVATPDNSPLSRSPDCGKLSGLVANYFGLGGVSEMV